MQNLTQLVTVSHGPADVRVTCDKSLSREEWITQLAALGIDTDQSRFFDHIDNGDGTETIVFEVQQ